MRQLVWQCREWHDKIEWQTELLSKVVSTCIVCHQHATHASAASIADRSSPEPCMRQTERLQVMLPREQSGRDH
jgi:hypothetical protein